MATNSIGGKTCIVTGGGSGLGRALAITLADAGARVAICGRNNELLNETVAAATVVCGKPDMVRAVCVDIREREQVLEFAESVREWAGPVEILINNAAVMLVGPIKSTGYEDYREMVETNLLGVLSLTTAFMEEMIGRRTGSIVNISSISSRVVGAGMTVYAATKRAVDAFSEGLRLELSSHGIRTISVQLGAVATPLNDKIRDPAMRRFIKARAGSYTEMPPEYVANEIVRLLQLPPTMTAANLFLVPTDQLS